LGDQGLISGANFLTMVLLARTLGPSGFGVFALAYSALLFANILQSTLITQPHNVLGSTRSTADYGSFTFTMAGAQIVLALIEALITGCVAGWAAYQGLEVAGLLVALIPAIVGWQMQEFVRRVLYTESRFRCAFFNDCISYGGQTLVVMVLWWMNCLTGKNAMYTMTVTSSLAAIVGLWQIRGSLTARFDKEAIFDSWHFGKWLTGAELLQWSCSLQMYLYLAAIMLGTAAAGELRAAQILFGPARVIAFYLISVLPMRFARAFVQGGHRAVHSQLVEASIRILPWLASYSLLVAVFAYPLLKVIYHDDFAGDSLVLVIYSFAAFVEYVQVIFTSALSAKRLTRSIFFGQLGGLLVTGLLSWWIIRWFGVAGAPMALGVSTVLITAMFWRSYRGSMKSEFSGTEAAIGLAEAESMDVSLEPVSPAAQSRRVELLRRAFQALERDGIPFCVTHGYRNLETAVDSDVDCVVSASVQPHRIAKALRFTQQDGSAAKVVQWFADGAQYIIIADDHGRSPEMVQLHLSPAFELNGRVFYTAEEILASKQRCGDFYVPSPAVEFACILLNRITKGFIKDNHATRLIELFQTDAAGCEAQVRRFWSDSNATLITDAMRSGVVDALHRALPQLAADAHHQVGKRQLPAIAARTVSAAARRASRWLRPKSGFHVVFLGPDGVGKSTIIEHVRESISPAFLRTTYHTFAPSIIPHKFQPEKPTPHALPPRSLAASLVKAAWWSMCYTCGYLATIHGDRARGGFAMNHRYLLDAIVDPKRYRYSGPTSLLRAIWFIAPKPDLVILLDAPAEVIQARKKEVAFEETARQRKEYLALLSGMKYGRVVNAARPIDAVVAEVNEIILRMLSDRVARQVGGDN
jgi:O-antigen/teichoic acid export membrane protein/adenylate kinase